MHVLTHLLNGSELLNATLSNILTFYMLLVGKSSVADVRKEDVEKIGCFELDSYESWKVVSIREIIQVKQGLMQVPGFGSDELETILNYLCTS